MSDVSSYIKQLRLENKMRQKDFGRLIGVSNKAVWTWEQGRSTPSLEQLKVIADHFGISIEYFVTGDPDPHRNELAFKYKDLISKIDKLTPEDRWKLEGRIDGILESYESNRNTLSAS